MKLRLWIFFCSASAMGDIYHLLIVSQAALYSRRLRQQMRNEHQLFTNLPLRPCWERDLIPDQCQQVLRYMMWMPGQSRSVSVLTPKYTCHCTAFFPHLTLKCFFLLLMIRLLLGLLGNATCKGSSGCEFPLFRGLLRRAWKPHYIKELSGLFFPLLNTRPTRQCFFDK